MPCSGFSLRDLDLKSGLGIGIKIIATTAAGTTKKKVIGPIHIRNVYYYYITYLSPNLHFLSLEFLYLLHWRWRQDQRLRYIQKPSIYAPYILALPHRLDPRLQSSSLS